MTEQRWQELIERLRAQKWILEEDTVQNDQTTIQTVIAHPPSGRVQLVFTIKPKYLGTNTTFTRRAGASVIVRPTYSADETVTVFELYRWVNDDWQRIEDSASLSAFT